MHGGTAESQVVPLRKKSDIREGRGQKCGFKPGGVSPPLIKIITRRNQTWRGGVCVFFFVCV